jgi:hypothetical protein
MDTQGNILKLSFLLSYLALLICVVGGIPFMTAVFRAVILMTVFTLVGYGFRWYLLHVVSSVQIDEPSRFMGDEQEDNGEFDISDDESDASASGAEEIEPQTAQNVEFQGD